MENRVMRLQLLLIVVFAAFEANGQMIISDILQVVDVTPLPHYAHKGVLYDNAIIIDNTKAIVPNRVYEDFQLAKIIELDEVDNPPTFLTTFDLINKGNHISLLRVGCGGDWMCDHLVISDIKGEILSSIEVAVHHSSGVAAKQFAIFEDGTLIVSVLKPISGSPILLDSFETLSAVKMEYFYLELNGEFVLQSTKRSSPALYSREQLLDSNNDFWR
ncbi:MAG: hypothetical protein ACRC6R_06315 [Bacteroidales bacterium]